ncbi:type VII secretion integral membrane protein EccD [Dactylosporangium roseum]|uniref:Type VII secretion integral membrane protein EccD n=1 Tax=Dactylosporangium roseum TaxID=47989 RepID=A0ABY5Z5B7_9ACTN|nr:type VII secretion integral membrane protein EccD [Dactylosporangium roseum]UWZ37211.1 type VII secretion integral membrane protein EccD [Dactylosporangium roseum]
MPAASTGLARVTINAPQRRIDVALPDSVPLAELLPELLQHAGAGLADDGERHGGWLLRRADGTTLSAAAGLAGQGVHDGTILYLVPARTGWPELEFDDVVEAIAAGARRQGVPWSPAATRATALAAAGAGLAVAVVAALRFDAPVIAGVLVAVLVLAGSTASRAYGDSLVGAVLAAYGLPFAGVAGWLSAPDPATGAGRALIGGVALLLASFVAAAGVAHQLRLFVAGATAGLLAAGAGALAIVTRPTAAAAVVLAALVAGVAGLPLIAIRLGKLPMPMIALPADLAPGGRVISAPPDRSRIFAAVARTDEMLTGMLIGCALAAGGAALVLVRSGDVSGTILVAVAATAFLLRARIFVTVRQRLPLIGAGLAGPALLALFLCRSAIEGVALVSAAAVIVALAGVRAATRPSSPYVGRAADLLDVLCMISVVPLACAVLGLYGLFT